MKFNFKHFLFKKTVINIAVCFFNKNQNLTQFIQIYIV